MTVVDTSKGGYFLCLIHNRVQAVDCHLLIYEKEFLYLIDGSIVSKIRFENYIDKNMLEDILFLFLLHFFCENFGKENRRKKRFKAT